MGVALMTERVGRSEYTWYGRVVFGLMADRDIRNPTEMSRRIEAMGGYPRRMSGATVGNILKGNQNAPFEFQQYVTVILDQEKALTNEEREELKDAFTWGQKHAPELGYTRETLERAYSFVEEMRRLRSSDEESDA